MRNPTSMAFGLLALVGVLAVGTRMVSSRSQERLGVSEECLEFGTCDFEEGLEGGMISGSQSGEPPAPSVEAEACRRAGYLCFGLAQRPDPRVMRWADGTREIRIRITGPSFEDGATELALRAAAAAGVLTWQGTPFPIRVIRNGADEVDFEIRWAETLGGNQLGQTGTEWFRRGEESGMRVTALTLVTRSPFNRSLVLSAEQVRLTAAHEMGHALGLPHSDDPRDVMFPTNGAARISSADFETMNALYRIQNGALVDLAGAGH